MPFAGDNASNEFVFVTSKVVATRATQVSGSNSPHSSPQAGRRRLHLQPIPTHIDNQQASPTDHRQKAFASSTSSVAKATPLPPELFDLLPLNLRGNNAVSKFYQNSHRHLERPPEFVIEKGNPPARPPLPANYGSSGDNSHILDKHEPSARPDSDHNYDYLSDLVTSDAISVLGRSPAQNTRASSVTPVSLTSSSKTSHTPHHTAPAALGISSDSGISSGSSCSSSSMSSRSSSSKSLPRVDSKAYVNGRPLEPPASPKFCRSALSSGTGNSETTISTSSSGLDSSLTQVSITSVLASDGERASMFRRLETSTPAVSPLLDSFRSGSSYPTSHGSPRPTHKHVAIATITTMGQTQPTHTQHITTTTPPQQAKLSTSQPVPQQRQQLQHVTNNSSSKERHIQEQSCKNPLTSSSSKPTKSILKDSSGSVTGQKVAVQPLSSRAQQPLPSQLQQIPYTSIGSTSRNTSYNRSAPSSPEMRRAWNLIGIPNSQVSQSNPGISPQVLPIRRGSSASLTARCTSRSPSPQTTDAIYDNLVSTKPSPGGRSFSGSSRPTASIPPTVTPITKHSDSQCMPSKHNGTTSPPQSPPPARKISSPAPPVLTNKSPSPPMQRRNAPHSASPTGPVYPSPPPTAFHYYTSGDPNYPGYWAPVWGSSPQLCQQGQPAPCYTTYVCGHGGPSTHGAYPMPIMCDGRSHSCERLPPGVSAPNSPRTGRRSASPSPWRGGSASPIMARHSPSPEPGGASVGRPPRPRRPPAMRKSKTVEVAYLDLHPLPSGGPSPAVYGNQSHVLAGPSSSHAASQPAFITHYPYAHPQSFNVHASPYVPPQQHQNRHHHSGFLQQKDRPSSPTHSVSSAVSLGSQHKSLSSGQEFVAKEKVTYKRFYKCMKSLLKPAQ